MSNSKQKFSEEEDKEMKLEGEELSSEISVNDLNDETEKEIVEEDNPSCTIEPRERTNCEKMKNHRCHTSMYFITLLLISGIVLAICGAVGLFNRHLECEQNSTLSKLTKSKNPEEMLVEKGPESNLRTNSKKEVTDNCSKDEPENSSNGEPDSCSKGEPDSYSEGEPAVKTPTCISSYLRPSLFLPFLKRFKENKSTSILLGINLTLNAIIYYAFTTRKFYAAIGTTVLTPLIIVLTGLILFSATAPLNSYYTRENKSKRSIAYKSSWIGLTAGSAALMFLIYWLTSNFTGLSGLENITASNRKEILLGLMVMSGVSYAAVNAAILFKLRPLYRRPKLSQFLYLLFVPMIASIFGYLAFLSFFEYGNDITKCFMSIHDDRGDWGVRSSLYDGGIATWDDYFDYCAAIISNSVHFWRNGTTAEKEILYSFWKKFNRLYHNVYDMLWHRYSSYDIID